VSGAAVPVPVPVPGAVVAVDDDVPVVVFLVSEILNE
jgi:hypothetical protein